VPVAKLTVLLQKNFKIINEIVSIIYIKNDLFIPGTKSLNPQLLTHLETFNSVKRFVFNNSENKKVDLEYMTALVN